MSGAGESLAHVLGRLEVVQARVRRAVADRRRGDPDPDDAYRGLYLTDEHVQRLLEDHSPATGQVDLDMEAGDDGRDARHGGGGDGGRGGDGDGGGDARDGLDGLDGLARQVEARADAAQAAGERLRLRDLARAFGLSSFDLNVLLVALAPDLDPRFEKLFGYLHDDVTRRRASIGLAIELAGAAKIDHSVRARFDPASPLVAGALLVVEEEDRPFLTRSLRVPDRVAAHVLGDPEPDPALRSVLRTPPPIHTVEAQRLSRALAGGVTLVYCRQPPGLWCGALVDAALAGGPTAPLILDLSGQSGADVSELLRVAVRDACLLNRVLVAGPVDGLDSTVIRLATGGNATTVLFGGTPWDPAWADAGALVLDLHEMARRPAGELWGARTVDAGSAGLELAAFRLSPDQVQRAVAAAQAQATAEDTPLSTRHLTAGARLQNSAGLGRLARRVEPTVGWPDLVLPPAALAGLRHLTDRVRWRHRVLGDWRLRRGGGRGEGITALFAGEPGTGKTMAAEVVAGELGLDLYVIDLSTVVDKYIGETEKNLERVFSGAEGVNGVLFFDEADALFGKRSEVSDAHDRYANLEVAFLLQRMESFDGLAILATNLGANLDEAFARRLSLIVEFARPEVAQRRGLWSRSLAEVPLAADVDLDFCAEAFEVAGGDIRNIAVTAAYLAAADGGVVDMRWLIRAVRAEYRKLGRLCVEAEFGPYYPLLVGVDEEAGSD